MSHPPNPSRPGATQPGQAQARAAFPVNAAFAVALAILAALAWLSYRNTAAMLDADRRENRTHAMVRELDLLLAAVAAAEAGERAFLITGDEKYLPPYRDAAGQAAARMDSLRSLAQGDPRQGRRLREIEAPVADKLAELERTIAVRRGQGPEAARQAVAGNIERARLDGIRARVAGLQDEEQALRQARAAAKNAEALAAVQAGALGGLLSFALLARVFFLLRKEIAERARAEAEVFTSRGRLEALVEARTADLRREIAERKQAEEARARLAAIVESSQDAIIGKDLDGVVTSWNAAAETLFGYPAEEMLGRPFACVVPPGLVEEEKAILERVRRGEAVEHYETERLRKDGSAVAIAISVSPVRDGAGNIIGVSKIARDIGERKRAEQALQEAGRRKDEFLAMLAHELRNPLTPIMVAAQLLQKRGAEDPALVLWAGDTVKHQGDNLVHLVDQLLDVSRVTQGKITLRKSPVDLREPVARAVETARPFAGQRRHRLTAALPPVPVPVEADAVRIEQVLGNLLNNAVKYTPDGGRIAVELACEAGAAVLRVRDNGIGIAAAALPGVFDLFTQAERTLDRAQGGLGIGLALVKSLVELHGGSAGAASAGAGLGSEFEVRLPLLARPPAAAPPKPAAQAQGAARRVLVVDDNDDVRESMVLLLQAMGHEVRAAGGGQEALAAAGAEPFDAVLLDIGMPGLDGYAVARLLRQERPAGRPALIAMTGYGQDYDRQASHKAGFDRHLVKPVDPQELESILAGLAT